MVVRLQQPKKIKYKFNAQTLTEKSSKSFAQFHFQSESKKRAHDASPKSADESVPENGSEPKRGRGRPKGSKKSTAKPKKAPVPGRGRGRPKASSNDEAGSD